MSHEAPEDRPVFRPFTRESIQRYKTRIAELKARKNGQHEHQQAGVTDEFYENHTNYDNKTPSSLLEAGAQLPRPLQRQFPPTLVATPIEEIDPYYEEVGIPSFVVISKGRDIWRFSATKSLYIFDPFHPLRRVAIYMLVHPWFSFLVIVTILVNCIIMTLKPTKSIERTEIIFTTVYTFESCLKVTARGFIFTRFTYLRDPWNWLDFVVIVVAYVTMFGENLGNLSALRTFRVLRALKTVAIIPGMKTIVGAVIESVKNLKDVIILTCFSLSVFALLGLQIYSGSLSQVCILNPPENVSDEEYVAWNKNDSNWIGYGSNEQANLCSNSSEGQPCKYPNTTCLAGYAPNPNYGYTNFDAFNWALLCAFRLMTQDFWESLYQMVLRATGPVHIVFFMAAIFLGSIYLVNLILAIVAMSYDDLQRKNLQEEQDANAEEAAYLESKKQAEQQQQDHCYDYNVNAGYDRVSLENNSAYAGTLINPKMKDLQRTLSQNEKDIDSQGLDRKNSLSLPGSPFQSEKLNDAGLLNNKEKPTNGIDRYASVDNDLFRQNGANIINHTTSYLQNKNSLYNSTSSRISYSSHGDMYNKGNSPTKAAGINSLQNLHGYYTTKDMANIDDYLVSLRQKRGGNPFLEKCPNSESIDVKKEDEDEDQQEGALKRKIMNSCMRTLDKLCIWDCCWCWVRLQELFALIVFDPFMELFITLCIVVNTLFMAMDHHDMDPDFSYFLDAGNTFFTTTFAIEAFLKLIALSPKFYFREGWNIFDFLIVVLSLMEKAFEGIGGFSVLRSFRLLRVFKLAKSWPTLNLLITIMGKAMGSLGNLTFVLGIIIFIFAVMGNQLFGKYYEPKNFKTNEVPRWNFTDFMHSFMIVFRVLCGEWIESMWDCMHAYGWQCVPFFLATVIIGNLVVLSLFLALLLSSFGASNLSAPTSDSADTKKLQEAFDRFARAQKWVKNRAISLFKPRNRISDQTIKNGLKVQMPSEEQGPRATSANEEGGETETIAGGDIGEITLQPRPKLQDSALTVLNTIKVAKALRAQHEARKEENKTQNFSMEHISEEGERGGSEPATLPAGGIDANNMEVAIEDGMLSEYPADCFGESIYKRFPCCLQETPFWQRWKEVRHKCYCLVENKYFETLVIVLILISSMTLALEDVHLNERKWLQDSLKYIDKSFTVIFFFEMVLKWFAYGFKYYFTNAWCWLDFVIVMVSVLNFGAELLNMNKIQAFKTMRTLRALRPLRAMSRMQGMRVVVNALIQAIPAIFNVLLVCLIFWLIFAIMGVQFFNGKFAFCRANGTMLDESLVPNSTVCREMQYEWYNPPINFDNVPNAYLALFQVATWKGWLPIMHHAVDSRTKKELQPIFEDNINMYIYFVFFIIFGAFFTLNLFIGVIIDNFNEQKKKTGGSMELFMTEEQKKYYNAMKKLGKKKPIKAIPRPRYKLQALLFDITTNKKFDMLIMVFIMLNMVVMCADRYHAPPMYTFVLERLNLFFVAVFTMECVLKVFALRWYYFKEPWNVFDFVIVLLSIGGSILKDVIEKYFFSPTLLRVVRVVKIGRVLRLVKGARGIRTLLFALAMSLPALFNICLLLFLVMFIYAIFGMSFFMNVKKRASIDDTFNFGTFFKSFILLFQICTSAGWDGVLDAIMDESDCNQGTPDEPGDCGNKGVAIAYMVSYLIITFLVIINMYIAVILENYSQAQEDVEEGLTDDDYDMYYEIWQRFDPMGTQFIHVSQLSDLFDTLEEPLQIPKPNKYKIVDMEIPICVDDRVYCVEILDALTKNFFAKKGHPIEDTSEMADIVIQRPELEVISNTKWRQRQEYCARVIQTAWRAHKAEKDTVT